MALTDRTLAELAKLNTAIGPVPNSAVPIGNTKATGTITTIVVANLVDGETFTLDDGVNTAVVFEFDVTGDGVTGGNTAVDVSALTTADEVRDAIIQAVNGLASSTLAILASDGGAATVDLENELGGVAGNVTITDTVVDAGFTSTGMAGGVDYPTVYPTTDGEGVDTSEVSRAVVSVKPTGGDVVFSVVARSEGTTDKFEAMNNLESITARDGIGWKEIVNVAPEDEVAVYIESGGATLDNVAVTIAPCFG